MPARKPQKIEAQVVEAIRNLRTLQGSTPQEICNYISQEHNIPVSDIRRYVQLALKRGITYGILQRMKGGCYSYNQTLIEGLPMKVGDGEIELPCSRRKRRRSRRSRSRRRRRRSRSRYKLRRRSRRRGRRRRGKSRRRRGRRRRRREIPPEIDGLELKTLAKQPNRSNSLLRKESLPSVELPVCESTCVMAE